MGRVDSPFTTLGEYGMFCKLGNTLGSEGNIERVDFQYTTFKNDILSPSMYCGIYTLEYLLREYTEHLSLAHSAIRRQTKARATVRIHLFRAYVMPYHIVNFPFLYEFVR